jgi:hypothetical protein
VLINKPDKNGVAPLFLILEINALLLRPFVRSIITDKVGLAPTFAVLKTAALLLSYLS